MRGWVLARRGKIVPRDYQVEAAKWAIERRRAVVCMPTGTGKTVVAGLWIKHLLEKGLARKILFLEPTRFLVEQAAKFLREKMGLDARPLHGSLPGPARREAWSARIVVATPEIIVAEWDEFSRHVFDALVVDECHHTSGQDPYVTVVRGADYQYRLGLTALVPRSRRREIEESIGEIRCWGWDNPSIAPYIPEWALEVYEAPLNRWEKRLYEELENRWARATGRDKVLLGNAIRWLARDGALALRDTAAKKNKLSSLLQPLHSLLWAEGVRPAHKLPALQRILLDHEGFSKAIVFIDRVVVAEYVAQRLGDYNPVLLLGRRRADPRRVLEAARRPETRLIISTSAGEEGIDLPEADLVVSWSNTASPLRFVQRLGRILRATRRHRGGGGGGAQKYAVFIATPDTIDVDSLLDGLYEAEKAGVYVSIEPEVVEYLSQLSKRRRVLEVLYERPMPPDMAAQALGAPRERVEAALRWLARRGYVAYIYTHLGKTYGPSDRVDLFYKYYPDYLAPSPTVKATITARLPGGEEKTARNASYHRALRWLEKLLDRHGALEGVRAAVFLEERGLIVQKNRFYAYRVASRELVKLVADNAYSPRALED